MRDIIVGRNQSDIDKFGKEGTILIGKQYIKMGRITTLSNNIYLDVAKGHVLFICGKRGGGKSYTMGVIAEGMASLPMRIRQNLSFILLDTMGIYWTMKYPNKKDETLLAQWGLKPEGLDVKIFTPKEFYYKYKDQGIPTDFPFTLRPAELTPEDWHLTFDLTANDPAGILLEKVVGRLKREGVNFDIDQLIQEIQKETKGEQSVKDALENRLLSTKEWGVFDAEGTKLTDLVIGGQVTVLDVSCYATMPGGWKVKALIVGLVGQRLFIERMIARKNEEYDQVHSSMSYFSSEEAKEKIDFPIVWLIIDEAHEFLPVKGKTAASNALITIMREGRQPGICLILATQQPGKIHTDVMTQSDTVLSHRITAKLDTEALGMLMQSYMREGLSVQLDHLPRVKGAGILFDDSNERMYPMRIRPRTTWHGGEAPVAVHKKKKEI
ncbi:ATP-binding protein [Nanoarchaeota archaeon]